MANTIKIKRGLKAELPTLEIGEQGYCTDTNELFIGTSGGNVLINDFANNLPKSLVYGIQWNQPEDTVTRLGNSIGFTAGSDFTALGSAGVWNLRRCMVNDDLSINYYIDPADPDNIGEVVNTATYTTGDPADYTGGHGQVMVEIPKFYWKYEEPIPNIYQWFVSPIKADIKFEVHPSFITDGVTKDYIYMSAFEGTVDTNDLSTGKLRSISGVQPDTSTQLGSTNARITGFRTFAQARGTGWQIQTYWATNALQVLYSVEYANFDSQTTIGQGIVNKASGSGNQSENTGATISLGNTSGAASGTNGLVSISYRGVENFWGNILKWVDGINIINREAFVANENFTSITFGGTMPSGYTFVGSLATSSGFVSNIQFPHFLATETSGSSTSHLHDSYSQSTGERIARFGGFWADGLSAGAFRWSLDNVSVNSSRIDGSRLQIL
jgi:hypothetical protein